MNASIIEKILCAKIYSMIVVYKKLIFEINNGKKVRLRQCCYLVQH